MNWLRRKLNKTEDECCGEKLSAYIDRELTPEERVALERHLAECEDCRWNLETLRQTVEWTRSSAPVRLPRVFTIPVETGAPQAVRARRPAWGLPLLQGATALVALLFVVVVAGDLTLGSATPRSEPQMVAVQATTVLSQAVTSQPAAATEVVEHDVAGPAAAAGVVEELSPAEAAAAKAAPTEAITAAPSAPEVLSMAAPTATLAAEAGGIGGGEPALSVTMEVLAVAVEPPPSLARAAATPTVTVTLAITAMMPWPTPTLTVEVTLTESVMSEEVVTVTVLATPEAYLAATAAPARALADTAASAAETPIPAPVQSEATANEAQQGEAPAAAAELAYSEAAPSEAPAALSAGPEPTVVAAAPEVRDAEQGPRSGEEQGIVGALRESVAPWFGLAEIVLGAAFVLLALVTAVVMLRRQPR